MIKLDKNRLTLISGPCVLESVEHATFMAKEIKSRCDDLDIQPSDCVLYGITDKNHKEFGDYDRGSRWRRVCISSLLGDKHE